MSTSLLWQLTKNHSCYIHKQKNGDNVITLTADPLSTRNLHCAKDAGLVHRKAATVLLTESKKGKPTVSIATKSSKSNKCFVVKTGANKGFQKSIVALKKTALSPKYLASNEHDILIRYSVAQRAQRRLMGLHAKAQHAKKVAKK